MSRVIVLTDAEIDELYALVSPKLRQGIIIEGGRSVLANFCTDCGCQEFRSSPPIMIHADHCSTHNLSDKVRSLVGNSLYLWGWTATVVRWIAGILGKNWIQQRTGWK